MKSIIKRRRICLILTEFPPRIGGMQTHAVYLAKYLHNQGHAVEVLTYRNNDQELTEEAVAFDKTLAFPVRRVLSRIGYFYSLSIIEKYARNFKSDFIYASNVFYGVLSERLNIPVVCRCVGNDVLRPWIVYPFRIGSQTVSHPLFDKFLYGWFKCTNFPEWIEVIFRKRRFALMEQSIKKNVMNIVNSHYTESVLHKIDVDPKKITVVSGGVDPERFKKSSLSKINLRLSLNLPSDAFVIMTACRLVPKKGLDFLLKSFQLIIKEITLAHLVIVGDGKEKGACERICQKLNLESKVTFAGKVIHEKIREYYWASDLFVLASREYKNRLTGIKDVETMGRVLCEANAAGVPVLASRSGGIPSVVSHGKNGLLFIEDDPKDFIDHVIDVYCNRMGNEQMIQNGLLMAKLKFDWSVVLRKHDELFSLLDV